MAARKSCTHLTWAEAKAKVGGSSTSGPKKGLPKKMSHDKALAAKIVAKHGGVSQGDMIKDRQAAKRAKRDAERAAAMESKRAEEKERERFEQVVKPSEQAKARLAELAREHQAKSVPCTENDDDDSGIEEILECKQMHLEELLALEAIYADTEQFLISHDSQDLREKLELLEEDQELQQQAVLEHSPASFTLQLEIEDNRDNPPDEMADIVVDVLLQVSLPRNYPLQGGTPNFDLVKVLVTDRNMVCSANKPLESLAFLEKEKLEKALQTEAQQIVPDPCVYELVSTWLPENIFDYLTMKNHPSFSKAK